MAGPRASRLRRQLRQHATRLVARSGLALSPACDQMLTQLVDVGVQRLEAARLAEDPIKIRTAEDALRRLVRRLGDHTQRLGRFPVVDHEAYRAALKDLCPLWPFC